VTTALRIDRAADDPRSSGEGLTFDLPEALVAHEPPEARGIARDGVRLLVTGPGDDDVRHARFRDLPGLLAPGDVLVVNASATISASLDGWRSCPGGRDELIELHLSSPVPHVNDDNRWVIELRRPTVSGTRPLLDARGGERLHLRGGGVATLRQPYRDARGRGLPNGGVRLWEAEVACPGGVLTYAARFGTPIRYGYVRKEWPLSAYQTVFATEPGSAEMPSAGRPFSLGFVRRLERAGVVIVPIVLHTGVASLESGEPPYPERYRVPATAAAAINQARQSGGRVIAVGTTVVRALETVAADDGTVHPGEGWTDLVITPERGVHTVDALLTGFHEPRASHLAMLEAIAGRRHLSVAYRAALDNGYLWHEFGDLHLLDRRRPVADG
jgi:S-adenosylmethionine:tRNA ribosyltransferase-isomerase